MVVGVGDQVNADELNRIAGPDGGAMVAASFDDAVGNGFIQHVIEETCAIGKFC